MAALAADSVTIRFGDTVACDGARLELPAGSSVAIVGASGSGKTSLLLSLAGLLRPDSGQVLIAGQPVWSRPRRERDALRRRHIGYVAQFGDLIPELSLAENVGLPLRLVGSSADLAQRAALRRMAQLDIAPLASRYPDEVSGGELQRAAIARSLVHDPSVVLADEPTGALDEDNRLLVMHELLSAARTSGTAVVIVTHDKALAASADRVLRMAGGHLESPAP